MPTNLEFEMSIPEWPPLVAQTFIVSASMSQRSRAANGDAMLSEESAALCYALSRIWLHQI